MTHSALGSTARFAFTQACKDGMRLNLRRSAEDVCLQAAKQKGNQGPISTSALHSELQVCEPAALSCSANLKVGLRRICRATLKCLCHRPRIVHRKNPRKSSESESSAFLATKW